MPTINLSFDDTFNVYDRITGVRIGEISLMSGGWAAYMTTPTGRIKDMRIGTYKTAELAIRAIDEAKPPLKALLKAAHPHGL
jgi:hypothetical protein